MDLYDKGLLSKETRWNDLSSTMLSYAAKTFFISLALMLILIIVSMLFSLLISIIGGMLLVFLFMIFIITTLPPLTLIIFPAYFQGDSTFESIKKGFSLGFKNWGTTFATLFIIGIMMFIITIILSAPYQLFIAFNPESNEYIAYLLAIVYSLSSVLTAPFMFVFLAFQYFAIAEKEEGISLQSNLDEFDRL